MLSISWKKKRNRIQKIKWPPNSKTRRRIRVDVNLGFAMLAPMNRLVVSSNQIMLVARTAKKFSWFREKSPGYTFVAPKPMTWQHIVFLFPYHTTNMSHMWSYFFILSFCGLSLTFYGFHFYQNFVCCSFVRPVLLCCFIARMEKYY